jgi:hypothetical protein
LTIQKRQPIMGASYHLLATITLPSAGGLGEGLTVGKASRYLGLLVLLLVLVGSLAGCGGGSQALVPPGPPGIGDHGADPGNEFDPPVIPEDIVYEDTEPSGFLSCTATDPETGEQFTADYANDEILVTFTADATMAEIESAFAAVGAHRKRYIAFCGVWVAGLDVAATTCAELQAKVNLLEAQPKVTSASKNGRPHSDAIPNG